MKCSILSNLQTCSPCNQQSIINSISWSIIYSISCFHETPDLNLAFAEMRSNSVKISSQKTFETLKISLSWFNFLKLYELQYINHVKCPVVIANNDACWHVSNYFPFLFFPLAQYFTFYDSDPVLIWSLVSLSCTAGYPGCPVLCWVT